MSTLVLRGPSPPDDPLRRLIWVLPLAVLLVSSALLLSAYWLRQPTQPPTQRPVDARIYELPPASASAPARPSPPAKSSRSRSAQPPASAPAVPTPHIPTAPKPVPHIEAKSSAPSRSVAPEPAPALKPKVSDWAALSSQMNSVASSIISKSQFAQVHDPHTLVARYYLAAILEKLQRVGDMIYTGQQVGDVDVRLIIGADGSVHLLELSPRGGATDLAAVARHIVDLSAPFSPFPAELMKQSRELKLEVHMRFLGFHNVGAS